MHRHRARAWPFEFSRAWVISQSDLEIYLLEYPLLFSCFPQTVNSTNQRPAFWLEILPDSDHGQNAKDQKTQRQLDEKKYLLLVRLKPKSRTSVKPEARAQHHGLSAQ